MEFFCFLALVCSFIYFDVDSLYFLGWIDFCASVSPGFFKGDLTCFYEVCHGFCIAASVWMGFGGEGSESLVDFVFCGFLWEVECFEGLVFVH